jgi:hypothetical protein
VDAAGEVLLPLIITPVLYKRFEQVPLIPEVWARARLELQACRRLVIIGYSFPSTDFQTRRLLIETFRDSSIEELVVVNPDTSVVELAKRLCNFRKTVLSFPNLDEFMNAWPRPPSSAASSV